jgi:hypothetical protein
MEKKDQELLKILAKKVEEATKISIEKEKELEGDWTVCTACGHRVKLSRKDFLTGRKAPSLKKGTITGRHLNCKKAFEPLMVVE